MATEFINGEYINTVGVAGDGQLGRMLAQAGIPLGIRMYALGEPAPGTISPAAQAGAEQVYGSLKDPQALERLAQRVGPNGVITWEVEHINAHHLLHMQRTYGTLILPNPADLIVIQDKLAQKKWLDSIGVAVAPFGDVRDPQDVAEAIAQWGTVVIKNRFGGYDGQGNRTVTDPLEIEEKMAQLGGQNLLVEKRVRLKKELSVISAIDVMGNTNSYPVVEMSHVNDVCDEVIAPAQIEDDAKLQATLIAHKILSNLQGAGLYAFELFLTEEGEVLANEIAPRVHNTGHWSISGAETSQFEQQLRAITGRPLGSTRMLSPVVVMKNILGRPGGYVDMDQIGGILLPSNAKINMYGKSHRPGRKLGHIEVLAETVDEASTLASDLRERVAA